MKYSALLAVLAVSVLSAQTGPNDARAREIYKQLVEINTTDTPAGNVTRAAEAVAARLKAAGFPAADIQILGPDPRKGNLVFRFRGTGVRKPLLLLAHLDVVEAKREDWPMDPFTFVEKDGSMDEAPAMTAMASGRHDSIEGKDSGGSRSDPGADRRQRRDQRRRVVGENADLSMPSSPSTRRGGSMQRQY